MTRFNDISVSREGRYRLGRDIDSGAGFLSVPVANRMIDYEEYYRLSEEELANFFHDGEAATRFAEACRQRLNDDRLILTPGSDRGTAI